MTVPQIPDGEPNALIVWAMIFVVLSLVSLLTFTIKTYKKAEQVDKAVNNVGPGEATLVEKVTDIRQDLNKVIDFAELFTQRGWTSLPGDLDTSAHLTETIRAIQAEAKALHVMHDLLRERIEYVDAKVERHLARHPSDT